MQCNSVAKNLNDSNFYRRLAYSPICRRSPPHKLQGHTSVPQIFFPSVNRVFCKSIQIASDMDFQVEKSGLGSVAKIFYGEIKIDTRNKGIKFLLIDFLV